MRVGDVAQHGDEIDAVRRAAVDAHLGAAQRQEIVDQPPHAPRLVEHDAQEFFRGRRIVARRAEQRLDEAGERGERRAQLVAGIGDEIGAHAGDRQPVGDIVEGDEDEAAAPPGERERAERHRVDVGRLARLVELDATRLSAPALSAAPRRISGQRKVSVNGSPGRVAGKSRAARALA